MQSTTSYPVQEIRWTQRKEENSSKIGLLESRCGKKTELENKESEACGLCWRQEFISYLEKDEAAWQTTPAQRRQWH